MLGSELGLGLGGDIILAKHNSVDNVLTTHPSFIFLLDIKC